MLRKGTDLMAMIDENMPAISAAIRDELMTLSVKPKEAGDWSGSFFEPYSYTFQSLFSDARQAQELNFPEKSAAIRSLRNNIYQLRSKISSQLSPSEQNLSSEISDLIAVRDSQRTAVRERTRQIAEFRDGCLALECQKIAQQIAADSMKSALERFGNRSTASLSLDVDFDRSSNGTDMSGWEEVDLMIRQLKHNLQQRDQLLRSESRGRLRELRVAKREAEVWRSRYSDAMEHSFDWKQVEEICRIREDRKELEQARAETRVENLPNDSLSRIRLVLKDLDQLRQDDLERASQFLEDLRFSEIENFRSREMRKDDIVADGTARTLYYY
jgi:hypothetical protein